jgi:hypothetical protein
VRFAAALDTAICTCSSTTEVPLVVTISRSEYETEKRLAKEMEKDGDGDRKKLLQGLLNDIFVACNTQKQSRDPKERCVRVCVGEVRKRVGKEPEQSRQIG